MSETAPAPAPNLNVAATGARRTELTSKPYPPDKQDRYAEITRQMIVAENMRINERMSWMIQLHGFLFAALAFAWDKGALRVLVLSVVGICSSLAVGYSVRLAVKAVDRLESEWDERCGDYDGPRVIGWGKKDAWALERFFPLHAPFTLPAILFGTWLLVFLFALIVGERRAPVGTDTSPARGAPVISRPNTPAPPQAPTPPAPRSPAR